MTLVKIGPKPADHETIGRACAACGASFSVGDCTALIVLGPGPDPDQQTAMREGRDYDGVAVEVHWTCAGGAS